MHNIRQTNVVSVKTNRETRMERIKGIFEKQHIPGEILQIKIIHLNIGPVKCVACGAHVKKKSNVWRIVVKNPHAPVQRPDETLSIRWLDKKEYRLCLDCEPKPSKTKEKATNQAISAIE